MATTIGHVNTGNMAKVPSAVTPRSRSTTPPTPITDFASLETQKENIRPLESGRSAATLVSLFEKDTEAEAILKEGHERYERLVKEAEKREQEGEDMEDGVSDLLDAYQQ
jgi:checkpoint serine/threonine-protein kinase